MGTKEWSPVSRVLAGAGGHWSDTLIWAKDRFVLGRADDQRQFGPIWYGWREAVQRHWCGDRDQGDCLADRPAVRVRAAPDHEAVGARGAGPPQQRTSRRRGARPVPGSGTTLIAAERTGRTCFAMELGPRYVDSRRRVVGGIHPIWSATRVFAGEVLVKLTDLRPPRQGRWSVVAGDVQPIACAADHSYSNTTPDSPKEVSR